MKKAQWMSKFYDLKEVLYLNKISFLINFEFHNLVKSTSSDCK